MSTIISIQSGALTASRTFANDTKARTILLAFYAEYGLGPASATNQEKLQAVLDWFVTHVALKAAHRQLEQTRDAARTQAEQDNTFE